MTHWIFKTFLIAAGATQTNKGGNGKVHDELRSTGKDMITEDFVSQVRDVDLILSAVGKHLQYFNMT